MPPTINSPGYEDYRPSASQGCKQEQLTRREQYFRRHRTIRQGWKLNLANAHILCGVPVSQIIFYFGCKEAEVERWCKAVHKRGTLGYTKWRHELDLYEIAGVTVEELAL